MSHILLGQFGHYYLLDRTMYTTPVTIYPITVIQSNLFFNNHRFLQNTQKDTLYLSKPAHESKLWSILSSKSDLYPTFSLSCTMYMIS